MMPYKIIGAEFVFTAYMLLAVVLHTWGGIGGPDRRVNRIGWRMLQLGLGAFLTGIFLGGLWLVFA